MYCITEEKSVIENEEYTVYGIKCDNAYVPNVPNVSADRGEVEQLVKLCNDGELSPCHLHDVVVDWLNR